MDRAGVVPGSDVRIALDVAATQFFSDGIYDIHGRSLSSADVTELIGEWVDKYPILSVEDGLAEDDWENWPALYQRICDRSFVVGDDLLCTNVKRISRAIEMNCANTLLLKVNQIGTLSEALESLQMVRNAGWRVVVSARSGETEDNWLADLAVGWGADFIKIGSITQSERLAKYNRLLEIENETGWEVKHNLL